ncbi:MAG: anthranilate synthase component I [Candidatus Omnitrophica bacterium]|nr:anthranilate synthase component I [Candidatus Omnitrophota bacterium]
MNINPSLKEFTKLAKNNNLIVLSHTFYSDWLTPLSIYYGLSKTLKGDSFLLESVEGEEKVCQFSFLGFMPIVTFKSKDKTIFLKDEKISVFQTKDDPLSELRRLMRRFKVAPKENLRFFGGFVGYIGYDTVRFYEPVGRQLPDTLGTFDTYLILPKFLIIFDHLHRHIEILSFVLTDEARNLKQLYRKETAVIKDIFNKIATPHKLPELNFSPKHLPMRSNFKKNNFYSAVRKAKEYIKRGDIIQTVLSQRFETPFKGDPFNAYRYLRVLNPSPYMFYFNFSDVKIAGSSPEMLLRFDHGELITRPIAGTRKRGKNEQEDKNLERSLLNDPKERAEHIMLVDLARNDLGRVAQKAKVHVPIFMSVERFSHVMHIVSEVRASLRSNEDAISALISCFPAGTLSGAPKVRAMQIINELELEKRGIYGGCAGYFSFTNSLDTCIIIRTIIFKGGYAYVQAGAGIVYDSLPQKEYRETLNKAKAQMLALELAAHGS